jgi:hypothetical protein
VTKEGILVILDVTPEQVVSGLPEGLIPGYTVAQGFSDKLVVVPTKNFEFISFRLSFDGESELIGQVDTNLFKYDEQRCNQILRSQFPEQV